MVKEYAIILAGKEVYASKDKMEALSEYSKNKYLIGFTTITTATKEDATDARILNYILDTPKEDRVESKLTKVLIERSHTNKARGLRSKLVYRFKPE